jgi:hypothetical protein
MQGIVAPVADLTGNFECSLLVSFHKHHGSTVCVPRPRGIVNQCDQDHGGKHNWRPVQRRSCDWCSKRPECEEPERRHEKKRADVDGKAKLS